ncbi:multidrug ABC transporter ATP-binding protein, partial [Sulfolobus sp. F3]
MTINNVIVSVTDLRKMIGRREILKGLTFSIENGEVFGIVGP